MLALEQLGMEHAAVVFSRDKKLSPVEGVTTSTSKELPAPRGRLDECDANVKDSRVAFLWINDI